MKVESDFLNGQILAEEEILGVKGKKSRQYSIQSDLYQRFFFLSHKENLSAKSLFSYLFLLQDISSLENLWNSLRNFDCISY